MCHQCICKVEHRIISYSMSFRPASCVRWKELRVKSYCPSRSHGRNTAGPRSVEITKAEIPCRYQIREGLVPLISSPTPSIGVAMDFSRRAYMAKGAPPYRGQRFPLWPLLLLLWDPSLLQGAPAGMVGPGWVP